MLRPVGSPFLAAGQSVCCLTLRYFAGLWLSNAVTNVCTRQTTPNTLSSTNTNTHLQSLVQVGAQQALAYLIEVHRALEQPGFGSPFQVGVANTKNTKKRPAEIRSFSERSKILRSNTRAHWPASTRAVLVSAARGLLPAVCPSLALCKGKHFSLLSDRPSPISGGFDIARQNVCVGDVHLPCPARRSPRATTSRHNQQW